MSNSLRIIQHFCKAENNINLESFRNTYTVEPANPFNAGNPRTLHASVPLSGYLYSPPRRDRGACGMVGRQGKRARAGG